MSCRNWFSCLVQRLVDWTVMNKIQWNLNKNANISSEYFDLNIQTSKYQPFSWGLNYPWISFRLVPHRAICVTGGSMKSSALIGKYSPTLIHQLGYQTKKVFKDGFWHRSPFRWNVSFSRSKTGWGSELDIMGEHLIDPATIWHATQWLCICWRDLVMCVLFSTIKRSGSFG